nr:hypothetical protein [Tanacetum cinerariifolium]
CRKNRASLIAVYAVVGAVPAFTLASMQQQESLREFHAAYLQAYDLGEPQSFLVLPIAMTEVPPALPYNRRDFYQISLYTGGTTELQYAGHTLRAAAALWQETPLFQLERSPVYFLDEAQL